MWFSFKTKTAKFISDYKLLIIIVAVHWLFAYNYTDFRIQSSHSIGHVFTAKSIALNHDFDVTEYKNVSGVDLVESKGESFTAYPFMNGLLMAIPYFFLQIFYYFYTNFISSINGDISIIIESLTFNLINSIAYLTIGVIVSKILDYYSIIPKYKWPAVIGLMLGTVIFNYSAAYLSHVVSATFILLAFYSLFCADQRSDQSLNTRQKPSILTKNYFLAGSFVGLAFLTEFPTVLFSLAVLIRELVILNSNKSFIFRKFYTYQTNIKNLIIFAVPVAISLVIQFYYQWYYFGDPFVFAEILYRNQTDKIAGLLHGFDGNPFFGLYLGYFSPLKGMFLISPFLLFGWFGIKSIIKKDNINAILMLSYVLIISVVYAFWSDCFGASSLGARYLTSTLPMWAILSAFGLQKLNKLYFVYVGFIILAFINCFINLLDGLPAGMFINCFHLKWGMYQKSFSYLMRLEKPISPVILKYLIQGL